MFKVGETVIHPKFGACEVIKITIQTILGEEQKCLVLTPLFENHNNLKITLPTANTDKIGLRQPMGEETIEEIEVLLTQQVNGEEINGAQIALPMLHNKLSSGNPFKIAEVIRDLSAKIKQDGGKYDNANRRALLKQAKKRLASEMAASLEISIFEARRKIHSVLS
jgi:CarD family transcriptional regulator